MEKIMKLVAVIADIITIVLFCIKICQIVM